VKSLEIRQAFINYFRENGHIHQPSASLIPSGDPTLLFTSAGMVPFKAYFMGEQTPPSKRLTSIQKSFRTTDIDEVGDHKHLTFFEMLGNFSFGDYFKKEAILFGWEVCTEVFGLDAEKFYITVHLNDDEAYEIWSQDVGIPTHRIYRYGDKDNWWGPAGDEGPTGPCSELHYDTGIEKGCGDLLSVGELNAYERKANEGGSVEWPGGCHPNCDSCERFVELWNLVFTQFYQDVDGNRTNLPAPSVDTGMGLERATAILQGKSNVYETDLFDVIISDIELLTNVQYGQDTSKDYSIRVVAEHSRASTFLISDGVIPSNENRGYVLRRIIRRAIRHGRLLGIEGLFLNNIVNSVITSFGDIYPELKDQKEFVNKVIQSEEERFTVALQNGLPILENGFITVRNILKNIIDQGIQSESQIRSIIELESHSIPDSIFEKIFPVYFELISNSTVQNEADVLSGLEAFILYDTYGFPPELTSEICELHSMKVDMEEFLKEVQLQKVHARNIESFVGSMSMENTIDQLDLPTTKFWGYERHDNDAEVLSILVDSIGRTHLIEGESGVIVLSDSVFYPEGGGQIGDKGLITSLDGAFQVNDTYILVAGVSAHSGIVLSGSFNVNTTVHCEIDQAHRIRTSRNHTGTHMIHAGLRQILGTHVKQAGSLVTDERIRFDFSHIGPVSGGEKLAVQNLVNQKTRENLELSIKETSYTDAVAGGALAFFDERYGENVRVVSISSEENGDHFSKEVCGGTHLTSTGQIGTVLVLGESSVGGGMRRIEAITGSVAEELINNQFKLIELIAQKFQTPVSELEIRIDNFLDERDNLRKELDNFQIQTLNTQAAGLLEKIHDVSGHKVLIEIVNASSSDDIRVMCEYIKNKINDVIIVLGANIKESPMIVIMNTDSAIKKGIKANELATFLGGFIEGGGGGSSEFAQAGGKRADMLPKALSNVDEYFQRYL